MSYNYTNCLLGLIIKVISFLGNSTSEWHTGVEPLDRKSVQRYDFFLKPPNFSAFFLLFLLIIVLEQLLAPQLSKKIMDIYDLYIVFCLASKWIQRDYHQCEIGMLLTESTKTLEMFVLNLRN